MNQAASGLNLFAPPGGAVPPPGASSGTNSAPLGQGSINPPTPILPPGPVGAPRGLIGAPPATPPAGPGPLGPPPGPTGTKPRGRVRPPTAAEIAEQQAKENLAKIRARNQAERDARDARAAARAANAAIMGAGARESKP